MGGEINRARDRRGQMANAEEAKEGVCCEPAAAAAGSAASLRVLRAARALLGFCTTLYVTRGILLCSLHTDMSCKLLGFMLLLRVVTGLLHCPVCADRTKFVTVLGNFV